MELKQFGTNTVFVMAGGLTFGGIMQWWKERKAPAPSIPSGYSKAEKARFLGEIKTRQLVRGALRQGLSSSTRAMCADSHPELDAARGTVVRMDGGAVLWGRGSFCLRSQYRGSMEHCDGCLGLWIGVRIFRCACIRTMCVIE